MSIFPPRSIPSSPSTYSVSGFLYPVCALSSASIPPWVGASVLRTGAWVRGRAYATASPTSPVVFFSVYTSSSSYTLSPDLSSAPFYMHLPSSSPSPLPAPLRPFYLDATLARSSWSGADDHWYFLYSTKVAYTALSMPDHNPEQSLRLPHASVAMSNVTNRTHLVSRRQIIPPIPTQKTPGALSRATSQH